MNADEPENLSRRFRHRKVIRLGRSGALGARLGARRGSPDPAGTPDRRSPVAEVTVVIRVNCSECGRPSEFADYLRGLTSVCKNCGHRIAVPATGQPAPSAEEANTSVQV